MPRWGGISIAVGAVAAAASCRQLVGIGDQPPASGPEADASADADVAVEAEAAVCGPTGDACGDCLGASCCDAISACRDDATCRGSLDCILACGAGDEGCAASCVKGFSPLLARALACRAGSCAVACNVTCGGILGVQYPDIAATGPDCAACAATSVCNELTACATDVSCIQHGACLERTCHFFDRACAAACEYPLGPSGASDAVWNALHDHCATQCRLGYDWSCVGKTAWPTGPQAGPSTSLALLLYEDANINAPLAGATVRTCWTSDPTCSPDGGLVGSATSDSSGFVSVPAILELGQIRQYLDVSGGSAYPALLFYSPPLTASLPGDTTYTPSMLGFLKASTVAAVSTAFPLDPDKGLVTILQYDCQHTLSPGMTFEVSLPDGGVDGTVVYFVSGVPSTSATATDVSGGAGIFNVSPGPITVTTRLASTGQTVARTPGIVRAGTITSLLAAPLPP